jgi:hypothetical protein
MPDGFHEGRPVVPVERARQGESTGHVRYVLHTSLALAVAAGVALFALYVL